jgi:hypothetical protein
MATFNSIALEICVSEKGTASDSMDQVSTECSSCSARLSDSDSPDDSDVVSEDGSEVRMMRVRTWDWFEDDSIGSGECCSPLQIGSPMCPFPMFAMPAHGGMALNVALTQHDPFHAPQIAPMYMASVAPCGSEFAQSEVGGVPSLTAVQAIAETPVAAQKTTVMLRNFPNNYKRDSLIELLDIQGFSDQYDFVYLPLDYKSRAAIGYAFVNFTSHAAASRSFDVFNGFSAWRGKSRKVCEVIWSETHQGLDANIELVRNSSMNRRRVPEQCKPFIVKNGQRVAIPPPNKAP